MKKSELKKLLIDAYRAGQNSVTAIRVIDTGKALPSNANIEPYASTKEKELVEWLLRK